MTDLEARLAYLGRRRVENRQGLIGEAMVTTSGAGAGLPVACQPQ